MNARVLLPLLATVTGLPCAADGPALLWGRAWGGASYDYAYDLAVADDGGIIVAGSFVGPVDMDPTEGQDVRQSVNQTFDIYILRLNADGSYAWAFTVGGPLSDNVDAVAIDPRDGSIIAAGYFYGTVDFDPGPGEDFHTAPGGDADAFILKLTGGGEFVWARTIGGPGFDEATDVGVDAAGNITHTGYFSKTVDFDPGPGQDFRTCPGDWDAYVSQLGPGGDYHWTHTFGGPSFGHPDFGLGLAATNNGDILAVGQFHGTADFDPGPGEDLRTSNGFEDIYLTRYTAQGKQLWTFTTGGPKSDRAWAVAEGPSGEICLTGRFQGSFDFDPGSGVDIRTSNGESDIFITRLGPNGEYAWTRTAGGTEDYEDGRGLAVRPDGSVLVAGWFRSPSVDFDPTDGVDVRTRVGEIDALLWRLGADGSYLGATTWGSTFHDRAYTIALDGPADAYLCGFFSETMDFDPGDGADVRASNGLYDCYLMKLGLDGPECYPDCDGDGSLDLFDFFCYVNDFNGGGGYAECDGDGMLDLFDFLCFVNAFNQGC